MKVFHNSHILITFITLEGCMFKRWININGIKDYNSLMTNLASHIIRDAKYLFEVKAIISDVIFTLSKESIPEYGDSIKHRDKDIKLNIPIKSKHITQLNYLLT